MGTHEKSTRVAFRRLESGRRQESERAGERAEPLLANEACLGSMFQQIMRLIKVEQKSLLLFESSFSNSESILSDGSAIDFSALIRTGNALILKLDALARISGRSSLPPPHSAPLGLPATEPWVDVFIGSSSDAIGSLIRSGHSNWPPSSLPRPTCVTGTSRGIARRHEAAIGTSPCTHWRRETSGGDKRQGAAQRLNRFVAQGGTRARETRERQRRPRRAEPVARAAVRRRGATLPRTR